MYSVYTSVIARALALQVLLPDVTVYPALDACTVYIYFNNVYVYIRFQPVYIIIYMYMYKCIIIYGTCESLHNYACIYNVHVYA